MRQLSLSDLYHAARALQRVPHDERHGFCEELFWRAHVADKYVKRLQKLHPQWGDGSLRAAAMPYSCGTLQPQNVRDTWSCMAVILEALRDQSKVGEHSCAPERVFSSRICAKDIASRLE